MRDAKRDPALMQAAQAVGGWVGELLLGLSGPAAGAVQEIGLRAGRPVALSCGRDTWFPDGRGGAVSRPRPGLPAVSAGELAAVLRRLCAGSVYRFQEELCEGFLTLRGGHRVGVAGAAVLRGGRVASVREVSSLSIRLARERRGCADGLVRLLGGRLRGGLLLAGPPASGKTTLLRDLTRQLAGGETGRFWRVAVADERGELAACWQGQPQYDVGVCCDVLTGCPKAEALLQAVRALGPDFLVCDEVGSGEDARALLQCLHTGAAVIASIHASSRAELLRRPQAAALLSAGAFETVALLGSRGAPGEVLDWGRAGDWLAEAGGNAAAHGGGGPCRAAGVA